jgi:hypothetical protein
MLLKRILSPEEIAREQKERAMKALLNSFRDPGYDPDYDPMLKAASSIKIKPTLKIRRIRVKPLQTKDNHWTRMVQKQFGMKMPSLREKVR